MDFLRQAVDDGGMVPPSLLAARLGAAFAMGFIAAGIYAVACRRGGRRAEPSFLATLVLLAPLIALVTLVIGNNVARAFSLVGTLAIVRFRTVVEDTRDTAFVIFAVACGMCAGSGYYVGPLICAPLVLAGTWIFAGRATKFGKLPSGRLMLRLSGATPPNGELKTALDKHLPTHHLLGLATARGGSALDATYAVDLPPPERAYEVIQGLSAVKGVQEVEVKSE